MLDRRDAREHVTRKRSLSLALLVTCAWFIVELAAGFYTNSLALLADAAHMLTDLAALSLSLFALTISARPATNEKTYGYVRAEILAALANGVILVLVGLFIAYQAYHRLLQPPPVRSTMMLAVASVGLGANLVAARLLSHSDLENLNLRGAFLHVLGDIMGSLGAISAGIIMSVWGWFLADPVVSLVVAALILYSSWRLMRDSVDVLLEGTPRHLDIGAILSDLGSVDGVLSVHELHVWSITSGLPAMSCHIVLRSDADSSAVLKTLSRLMRTRHRIEHTTIQIEKDEAFVPEVR
ncbi:MAG: cation diffusion facilitator family transporter [Acidobacteriia bacterium]|nr:cation diffusion facilitator family transporter [Terriglobia bacterium]